MNTERNTQPQSQEDKFFGVKTTIDDINTSLEETQEEEEVIVVEASDDKERNNDKSGAEVSESDDDELESYSEKVQKRIKKLTWEREEAKRRAEQADALRQEAIHYARQVNQTNQQQANLLATGEARLVEQIKNRAALAVEAAASRYRQAYEAGDSEAFIKAQQELTLAQAEQREGQKYEQEYNARISNWYERQKYSQQQAAAYQQQLAQAQQNPLPVARPPSQESLSWATRNPWFNKPGYEDMTAVAYTEHQRLKSLGVPVDSDDYYDGINKKVRRHFPDYFAKLRGNNSAKPPAIVASGQRNNNGKSRKVWLDPHQLAVAKQLGITAEAYARQVQKESEKDG